ncbi:type II toxin-antitoxin system YafO family toxin [Shewanella algae]|uniref:type II toxin-antitoxin system YafO family toxin n=1 Tax=Shewanella algae TaxID=38313 RepID=UPI0031F597AC
MAQATVTYEPGLEAHFEQHGFDLKQLTQDLVIYFSSNKQQRPPYLGKDAPFFRPDNVSEHEVHHIHMFVQGITDPQNWSGAYNPNKRTSDSYLVYTYGYFEESSYRVLGFVEKDAHQKCRTNQDGYRLVRDFMYAADKFRKSC